MRQYPAMKKNRLLVIGFLMLVFLSLSALSAPILAPSDPYKINLNSRLIPPGAYYPLGTDHLGRCILSRTLYGARISLTAGLAACFLAMLPGIAFGFAAGLSGYRTARVLMWLVDVMLAFPALIPALIFCGIMGPSLNTTVLGMGFCGWAWWARFIRGQILSAREKEFVIGAKVIGVKGFRLIRFYIFPQIFPQIAIAASLSAGGMIVAISGLHYLGLGAQPPVPEWGAMLKESGIYMRQAPWMAIVPGLGVIISVLACNFLGEGLRDFFEVRPVTQR